MNLYKNAILQSLTQVAIHAIFSPFSVHSLVLTVPSLHIEKKPRRHLGVVRIWQPNWVVAFYHSCCYLISTRIAWESNHCCPERRKAGRCCVSGQCLLLQQLSGWLPGTHISSAVLEGLLFLHSLTDVSALKLGLGTGRKMTSATLTITLELEEMNGMRFARKYFVFLTSKHFSVSFKW